MVSLFLLLGCNLSYIVDLFAALHELASASASTLLKLASSVRALLKPYGDTLNRHLTVNTCHVSCTSLRLKLFFLILPNKPSFRSSYICPYGSFMHLSVAIPRVGPAEPPGICTETFAISSYPGPIFFHKKLPLYLPRRA